MTSIFVVCAVVASLSVGVLLAYGICHLMFALFHSHARQVSLSASSRPAVSTQVVEG